MIRFEPKQYERYKDTKTKWLGTIPAHWKVKRVKEAFISLDSKRIPLSGEERQTMKDAIYDYYGASGVIDKVDNYIFDEPLLLIGEDGANLLMRGSALAFIARGKYWVNNHAHVLRPKKENLEYLCYLLEYYDYTKLISGSAQPKLTAGALNSVLLMLPPLEEQQAIADYLDAKTAHIDRKIELLEAKTEKYADLKQSLINETVTRGLDKSVPMKDSGLEWIGQIPSHWEVKRVKDLFDERSQKGFPEEPLLIASQEKGVILKSDYSRNTMTVQQDFHLMKLVKKDDFVISLRSFEGGIEIANNQGIISAAYTILRATNDSSVGYYKHLFKSRRFISMLVTNTTGIREGRNVNYQQLKRELLPLPPLEECKPIAEYLEAKTAHIEKIIETINLEIEKLKELRKTLINDVVTGKVKVYEETIHE